ncbi:MAG: hypothetical protein IJP96_10340 [Synergistaceae bacterium]|nr:hypothetical protein [Synergistaceae bacterium]
MSEFLDELKKYQINPDVDLVLRVILTNGDKNARKHYQELLRENPEWEMKLILELAESDKNLYQYLFERMAISDLNSLEDAVKMLMRFYQNK